MDSFINFFDRYSLAILKPVLAYANWFRNTSVVVIIGALLAPMLALRWALPEWAFTTIGAVFLTGIAWLTIRFVAACIDER